LGSLHFWGVLEGTHLLTLMLFVGTILVVDCGCWASSSSNQGLYSHDAILPLTVFGFAFMMITGLALLFAKPLFYYHNIWFRLKMILLAFAMINVLVFHSRIQKSQGVWGRRAGPARQGPRGRGDLTAELDCRDYLRAGSSPTTGLRAASHNRPSLMRSKPARPRRRRLQPAGQATQLKL